MIPVKIKSYHTEYAFILNKIRSIIYYNDLMKIEIVYGLKDTCTIGFRDSEEYQDAKKIFTHGLMSFLDLV